MTVQPLQTIPDGGYFEFQGSGAKPYILKNSGGIYSCSCPAWRNQSKPIDVRTCKHLVTILGAEFETARTHGPVVGVAAKPAGQTVSSAPKNDSWAMLAESWTGEDPTGWWVSEKLDGVRAMYRDGKFITRNGNEIFAPESFIKDMPAGFSFDGELWMGRGQFQATVSIVRSQDAGDRWNQLFFMVFDVLLEKTPFEDRMDTLDRLVKQNKLQPHGKVERFAPKAFVLPQRQIHDQNDFSLEVARIAHLGGEGVMLRKPKSLYVSRRSPALLKVKKFHDAEAVVFNHQEGKGRHVGVMGALEVIGVDENGQSTGVQFKVGSGFTDQQRRDAAQLYPAGTVIEYQYQELTKDGMPRFPTFKRVRPIV